MVTITAPVFDGASFHSGSGPSTSLGIYMDALPQFLYSTFVSLSSGTLHSTDWMSMKVLLRYRTHIQFPSGSSLVHQRQLQVVSSYPALHYQRFITSLERYANIVEKAERAQDAQEIRADLSALAASRGITDKYNS